MWITKYRYKVLTYDIKKRVREIVLQVAEEMGIKVENGVVSSDHVHIFAEIPPNIKISDFGRAGWMALWSPPPTAAQFYSNMLSKSIQTQWI